MGGPGGWSTQNIAFAHQPLRLVIQGPAWHAHASLVPSPYTADELGAVLDSAIVWGYNTLHRVSCASGVVSNWWTVPDAGWPWAGELKCANSAAGCVPFV